MELLCLMFLSSVFYVSLYSELPIDDTARFTDDIASGHYQWDTAHLFMQPVTVLWHQYLSFGGTALSSQHHINTFCAVLSAAIFYILLWRYEVKLPRRITIISISIVSFNVLNLATSGHMKLTAYPFLTLSLYYAALWELNLQNGLPNTSLCSWRLWLSAFSLGISSLFLINSLVIAPCVAVAIILVKNRNLCQQNYCFFKRPCLSFIYCFITFSLFFSISFILYYIIAQYPLSIDGFISFLLGEKSGGADSRFVGIKESLARAVFGVIQNFSYTENVGPILRAWLNHQIVSIRQYASLVLTDIFFIVVTLTTVGLIYIYGVILYFKRRGSLVGFAFLAGTLIFAFWWNLSEADFYFQITLPTLLLAAMLPYSNIYNGTFLLWLLTIIVSNVILWAIPKAAYPFNHYITTVQEFVKPSDMVICFAAYPGKQNFWFFVPYLDRRNVLPLDQLYLNINEKGNFFSAVETRINDTLSSNGRVFIFQALDSMDWNSPWPMLLKNGLTKDMLAKFFNEKYQVIFNNQLAEIKYWELKKRNDRL